MYASYRILLRQQIYPFNSQNRSKFLCNARATGGLFSVAGITDKYD